jgi:hypothetical protein
VWCLLFVWCGLLSACASSTTATDASVFACDAPPIAYCRQAIPEGGAGCCGTTVTPLCRSGGGYACGEGALELSACTECSIASTCTTRSDCAVAPVTCCGDCGVARSGDAIALATSQLGSWHTAACRGGEACPRCAGRIDPMLIATCEAASCRLHDLHTEAIGACTTDTDCALAPATCCDCGALGAGAVVAFNPAHGDIGAITCDAGTACPPCVPTFTGVAAQCMGGHCEVVATP